MFLDFKNRYFYYLLGLLYCTVEYIVKAKINFLNSTSNPSNPDVDNGVAELSMVREGITNSHVD